MSLQKYTEKRDFRSSPEPKGGSDRPAPVGRRGWRTFVVQKHDASRLHYDFRLEWDGVLKSWAVPKGPSLDPHEKSLAVEVEDHPLDYADFEGVIPEGHYGGGSVMVWDRGRWRCEGDAAKSLRQGKLSFQLEGEKLGGYWTLVRLRRSPQQGHQTHWLLIKKDDKYARPDSAYDLLEEADRSVLSGRTMDEIAAARDRVWSTNGRPGDAEPPPPRSARRPVDPATIDGAQPSKLPKVFQPQLATLVPEVPRGDRYLHELKFDGYRILARCDDGVKLLTRRNEDWTHRFPAIAEALQSLDLRGTILDGEVVVLDEHGVSNFQMLQNLLRRGTQKSLRYYVFDAPYLQGFNLCQATQLDRKEAVRRLLAELPGESVLRYSDHIRGDGSAVVEYACRHALEGVVSKRVDAPYTQHRSSAWVKSKCLKRQEFVVGGWTDPSGSRIGFGALLLGYYREGDLVYCGRVGTGFNTQSLQSIHDELRGLATSAPPFPDPPTGAAARGVHWVEPQLVAEVEFTEWTDQGMLRHPSFQGLREDKDPTSIVRERAQPMPQERDAPPAEPSRHRTGTGRRKADFADSEVRVAGVKISHPGRVVYPDQGVTKGELAAYYFDIAEWILPYVADRPLSLVRCPRGRTKKCFYQKHAGQGLPAAVGSVAVEQQDGWANYVTIDDAAGLVALVQMGTLELHPWGARNDRLERPDQLVFDLDPDEGADWADVIAGAGELRDRLREVGLDSFLRITGGKGLHVVVPLTRRQGWDTAKRFARNVAEAMAADSPQRYVATASKAKRAERTYIDYLRNSRGATAVASYSTRARPDAPIATPLRWDELTTKLRPNQYHLKNIRQRLSSLQGDPWESFFDIRQSLTKAARRAYDAD